MFKIFRYILILTCILCFTACDSKIQDNTYSADQGIDMTDPSRKVQETNGLQSIKKDDLVFMSMNKAYSEKDIRELGKLTENFHGRLPGTAEGEWLVYALNGIEYYYAKYEDAQEPQYLSYSVISEDYRTASGVYMGMKKNELLSLYPDLAEWSFVEGKEIAHKTAFEGINFFSFPRTDLRSWTDGFEYALIGKITDTDDTRSIYIAFMIKDSVLTAVTTYYPMDGISFPNEFMK